MEKSNSFSELMTGVEVSTGLVDQFICYSTLLDDPIDKAIEKALTLYINTAKFQIQSRPIKPYFASLQTGKEEDIVIHTQG